MVGKIQKLMFQINFIRKSEGNIVKRFKKSYRFTEIYVYQKNMQLNKIKQQLQSQRKNHNWKNIIEQLNITQIKNKYNQIKVSTFLNRDSLTSKYNKQTYQSQARSILNRFFQYLALYYESLQSLVQGRREVLNNQNFVLEDGKTVKQKKQKFQAFIQKLFNKKIRNQQKQ